MLSYIIVILITVLACILVFYLRSKKMPTPFNLKSIKKNGMFSEEWMDWLQANYSDKKGNCTLYDYLIPRKKRQERYAKNHRVHFCAILNDIPYDTDTAECFMVQQTKFMGSEPCAKHYYVTNDKKYFFFITARMGKPDELSTMNVKELKKLLYQKPDLYMKYVPDAESNTALAGFMKERAILQEKARLEQAIAEKEAAEKEAEKPEKKGFGLFKKRQERSEEKTKQDNAVARNAADDKDTAAHKTPVEEHKTEKDKHNAAQEKPAKVAKPATPSPTRGKSEDKEQPRKTDPKPPVPDKKDPEPEKKEDPDDDGLTFSEEDLGGRNSGVLSPESRPKPKTDAADKSKRRERSKRRIVSDYDAAGGPDAKEQDKLRSLDENAINMPGMRGVSSYK